MSRADAKAFVERELQWREFHRWEETQTNAWTLPERLAWYESTLHLARLLNPNFQEDFQTKIERICEDRRKLSYLKVV